MTPAPAALPPSLAAVYLPTAGTPIQVGDGVAEPRAGLPWVAYGRVSVRLFSRRENEKRGEGY